MSSDVGSSLTPLKNTFEPFFVGWGFLIVGGFVKFELSTSFILVFLPRVSHFLPMHTLNVTSLWSMWYASSRSSFLLYRMVKLTWVWEDESNNKKGVFLEAAKRPTTLSDGRGQQWAPLTVATNCERRTSWRSPQQWACVVLSPTFWVRRFESKGFEFDVLSQKVLSSTF